MKNSAKPFLKWAGGKTQLLPIISSKLPEDINEKTRYIEPFIGAGAVFFEMVKKQHFEEYIINDINSKLISLYTIIRDDCESLLSRLEAIKSEYSELKDLDEKSEYFYNAREQFNADDCDSIDKAALFIFLNKTCFNGLYRENSKGQFNVPFGKHKDPTIYDETQIRKISELLNTKNEKGENIVRIMNLPFEALEQYIDDQTFMYFDPPYRPVTKGGFNTYSKSGFNDDDQIRLKNFYEMADNLGAELMLSNSDPHVLDEDDDFFDNLYEEYTIERVAASRMINRNGNGRGQITELLITNY